ncbi:MAG TPA: phosphoribosyltransferase family protein [Candidatus Manganitrophaceae bacterium]|nr:phosphoribosyltransferase family protein [Candidatus Manganitrophaceae bacterium]
MVFKNRQQAAALLAERLIRYKKQNPLVLGIPRGAAPMARIIADALDGEMDVALVHKLGAPDNPELAVGSIDESGRVYLGEYAHILGLTDQEIEAEKERQMKTLRERRALYTPVHPPADPAGRIVIVVDDGIATGWSMIAALRSVRAKGPEKLIAAAAVAPWESLHKIKKLADEVVCLDVPADFYAVGQFFDEFTQVSDEEVVALLQQSRSGPKRAKASGEAAA